MQAASTPFPKCAEKGISLVRKVLEASNAYKTNSCKMSYLVLLVLRDEIVHVALCLGELHLVHALARVPMQEGLAAEHGCKLTRIRKEWN